MGGMGGGGVAYRETALDLSATVTVDSESARRQAPMTPHHAPGLLLTRRLGRTRI